MTENIIKGETMDEDIDWKMIRFFGIPPEAERWEIRWFVKDGKANYHPHTGDMSMVEPAPPKDWKPYCFLVQSLPGCRGRLIQREDDKNEFRRECEPCPYRQKME